MKDGCFFKKKIIVCMKHYFFFMKHTCTKESVSWQGLKLEGFREGNVIGREFFFPRQANLVCVERQSSSACEAPVVIVQGRALTIRLEKILIYRRGFSTFDSPGQRRRHSGSGETHP
jgi:hypothetical protein